MLHINSRGIADIMDANGPQHTTSETTAGTTPADSNIEESSMEANGRAVVNMDRQQSGVKVPAKALASSRRRLT